MLCFLSSPDTILKQSFKKLQARDHKVTKQWQTAHEIGKKFGTFLSAMDNIRHWWLLMDPWIELNSLRRSEAHDGLFHTQKKNLTCIFIHGCGTDHSLIPLLFCILTLTSRDVILFKFNAVTSIIKQYTEYLFSPSHCPISEVLSSSSKPLQIPIVLKSYNVEIANLLF